MNFTAIEHTFKNFLKKFLKIFQKRLYFFGKKSYNKVVSKI